jgi:cyclophilin family peptidyl-prolyl cis-trans isomerase
MERVSYQKIRILHISFAFLQGPKVLNLGDASVPRWNSIEIDVVKRVKVPSGMKHCFSPRIVCRMALLGTALLMLQAGCGSSSDSDQSPTAAIGKSDANASSTAGEQGQASQKFGSDPQHPVVLIATTLGNIKVRLDADKAPFTVNNFLSYVRESFYDQTIIHQVHKGQGFLAGGYDVNRKEKPAHIPIRSEAENGLHNLRGTIAMVRQPDAIDSATSQFMINVSKNEVLDFKDNSIEGYGYCVFGEVIEGLDVIDKINEASVEDAGVFERMPNPPIIITSIHKLN